MGYRYITGSKLLRITACLVTCLIFLGGCDSARNGSQAEIGELIVNQHTLESVDCWFRIPKFRPQTSCYFMHVPQDYENETGLWIKFPVVKVGAMLPDKSKSPILHLGGGGPGNPMGLDPGLDVSWFWGLYRGMSVDNNRDLYVIDPRGVGYASPALNCYEYVDMVEIALGENLTDEEENARSLVAYQLCRDRLADSGINLSQYNSAIVARDMDALRQALGISKWNLYGVSYGSRYAQTIARDYPKTVESMILDAATFMDINYTERSGDTFLLTLERLFSYCENEFDCKSAMGNVRERFWELVDKLNSNPPLFKIDHPYANEKIAIVLTGVRFLSAYYNALYDASSYANLPDVIDSLENERLGIFENALYDWIWYIADREYGDGAANSHYCYEEAPFVDFQVAIDGTAHLPVQIAGMVTSGLKFSQVQCKNWNVAQAGAIENQAMETDVPTLFLHGALDPVLPVEDLQGQIKNFKNSDHVIFDEISHGIVGIHPCGIELAREFYDQKLKFRESVTCL